MSEARRAGDDKTRGGLLPWKRVERRRKQFVESLSFALVILSGIGALVVLIDPVVVLELDSGTVIKIGGEGFSDQLKGAVISLILVGGFTAVIAFWLGASNQGLKAQDSVNTIATAAAPATAAAVAAATTSAPAKDPLKTDTVEIDAANADISIDTTKPKKKGAK